MPEAEFAANIPDVEFHHFAKGRLRFGELPHGEQRGTEILARTDIARLESGCGLEMRQRIRRATLTDKQIPEIRAGCGVILHRQRSEQQLLRFRQIAF